MDGVVRADEEIGTDLRELVGRREHQFADAAPIRPIQTLHILGQGRRMHRNLGMAVAPEWRRRRQAYGPIAKGCALRRACNDADVLCHDARAPSFRNQTGPPQTENERSAFAFFSALCAAPIARLPANPGLMVRLEDAPTGLGCPSQGMAMALALRRHAGASTHIATPVRGRVFLVPATRLHRQCRRAASTTLVGRQTPDLVLALPRLRPGLS